MEFEGEVKNVPLEGIQNVAIFMQLVGYSRYEFVGMDGKKKHLPIPPSDLKAEMEGLGIKLSPDEWYLAGIMTKAHASSVNIYSGNDGVPQPYGFDPEENERKNAELLALIGKD